MDHANFPEYSDSSHSHRITGMHLIARQFFSASVQAVCKNRKEA